MQQFHNISLQPYNTFGIETIASEYIKIEKIKEFKELFNKREFKNPPLILSGGSNILFTTDFFDRTVIHIQTKGIETVQETENFIDLKIQAGEQWHEFVMYCVSNNYQGIENLALIPGCVGTAPIQNIGAYGIEQKDSMQSCEVFFMDTRESKSLTNKDCQFGYRDSIFKNTLKGKAIITSVTYRLRKRNFQVNTTYGAINQVLEEQKIKEPNLEEISQAIIRIRQSKLPDPKKLGNAGSFFKNPIVDINSFNEIKKRFPSVPSYQINEYLIKIPAAWLIDQLGYKGSVYGNAAVHQNQPLVLVNTGKAKGIEIYKLAQKIQTNIKEHFNINLEMEVNII